MFFGKMTDYMRLRSDITNNKFPDIDLNEYDEIKGYEVYLRE